MTRTRLRSRSELRNLKLQSRAKPRRRRKVPNRNQTKRPLQKEKVKRQEQPYAYTPNRNGSRKRSRQKLHRRNRAQPNRRAPRSPNHQPSRGPRPVRQLRLGRLQHRCLTTSPWKNPASKRPGIRTAAATAAPARLLAVVAPAGELSLPHEREHRGDPASAGAARPLEIRHRPQQRDAAGEARASSITITGTCGGCAMDWRITSSSATAPRRATARSKSATAGSGR